MLAFCTRIYVLHSHLQHTSNNRLSSALAFTPHHVRPSAHAHARARARARAGMYVIGGSGPEEAPLATVELFDSLTGRWVEAPSLATPRALACAFVLCGRLFVCGGAQNRSEPCAPGRPLLRLLCPNPAPQ
eukprot:5954188-Prymnesium_polylepis.1